MFGDNVLPAPLLTQADYDTTMAIIQAVKLAGSGVPKTIESFGFKGTPEELLYTLIFDLLPKYNIVVPPNNRYMTKNIMKKSLILTALN